MDHGDEQTHKELKDQRDRSTKKVKMHEEDHKEYEDSSGNVNQDEILMEVGCEERGNVSTQQENIPNDSISYKNMLLGINGMGE